MARRKLRPHYLAVTDGAVTEKSYVKMLSALFRTKIEISISTDEPVKLVRTANRLTQRGDFSRAWVITDVDEHSAHQLAEARKACARNVEVIVTNPCFEVWLIDHRQPCPGSVTQTREAEEFARRCGVTQPVKGKGRSRDLQRWKLPAFDALTVDQVELACRNAQKHGSDISGRGVVGRAPWTAMPRMIDEIYRDLGKHDAALHVR